MDDRNERLPLLSAIGGDNDDEPPAYPQGPGHRGIDTSINAARQVAPRVGTLQAKALVAIRAASRAGLTTIELAARLQVDSASIQPRTSELRRMGLIMDSGRRRRNPSGVGSIVWVARPEPMGNQLPTSVEAA
jgi:hypothetical protein